MYLHGPLTVSDMCRKFWITNCSVPSEELELASAAVFVLTAVAVVVVGAAVAERVGIDIWERSCWEGGTSDPPLAKKNGCWFIKPDGSSPRARRNCKGGKSSL